MKNTTMTLRCVGLMALLVGACGDDDASGAGSAGATEGASGGENTDSNGDASASMTSQGDASASGSTTRDDDDGDTGDSSTTASGSLTNGDDSTSDDDSTSGTDGEGDASASQGSATGQPTGDELCEAPGSVLPCDADSNDPFHAMGLNCPGGADEAIPVYNTAFVSNDPQAWRVARQFGSHIDPMTNEPTWGAKEGEKFLIISSGHISAPNAQGVITMTNGVHNGGVSNGNPDFQQLPAPMSPQPGSNNGNGGTPFVNCDLTNDCSDSLQTQWNAGGNAANDLLWFQFTVDVPGGTHGFEFDFVYFSAEFPEWVNTTYNDIFVVWSNSETYTGNLCFVNDQPCTVTALWPVQYPAQTPQLAGTGFEPDGATGWFTAKASAAPGESLQLTWAVFDMGDTAWDTAVIIDNWRWDCEGCVPSEVNPCGIRPIPT